MSTQQARREANQTGLIYSVKAGFNKLFPADQAVPAKAALSAKILQAVDLVMPILTEGSLLANLHVLRCAEQGNMPLIDQTFFNHCYAAVTFSTGRSAQQFKPADHPELAVSYTQYKDCLPDDHTQPERPSFIKDVSTVHQFMKS